MSYTTNLIYFIPEIYLTAIVLLLIIYGTVCEKVDSIVINNNKLSWLCIITLIFTIIIYVNIVANIDDVENIYGGLLYVDDVNVIIKILLTMVTSIILLLSIDNNVKFNILQIEYQLLLVLSTLGLLILVSSNELIILYLGLELSSLSVYVLATIKRNSEYSTEAGIKYYILGGLSSGLLLFGCAILYYFTGETNLTGISYAINSEILPIAIIFILIGLLFKLAAAPFHNWAPDVYEGSPTMITVYIATVPKLAILYLLINLITIFSPIYPQLSTVISVVIALSLIVGCIGGVIQSKVKRLLAYSAINHIGFILLGLLSLDVFGIQSSLIYMVNYIILSVMFFSIILISFNSSNIYLTQLVGLSRLNPILGITLALGLLSVAGIPPLSGFYAKFIILQSAVNNQFYLLTFLAVLTSIVSTFHYLRIIQFVYFKDTDEYYYKTLALPVNYNVNLISSILLGITLYFVLTLLIYPAPLSLFSFQFFSNFLI
jgi:NADH-quinone oxidoreductase subunit N